MQILPAAALTRRAAPAARNRAAAATLTTGMLSDANIRLAARAMAKSHGADARREALRRAAGARRDRDYEAAALWRRIAAAVEGGPAPAASAGSRAFRPVPRQDPYRW